MKECALQLKGNALFPFTEEDKEALSEYKPNQVLKCKLQGVKKPRSLEQLGLFMACAKITAENTDDHNWNTKDKVVEQVKIKVRFIESYMVVEGNVHMKTRSISFKNLPHMEACNFFEQGFKEMASFLQVTVDELVKMAQEKMGRRL